MKPLTTSQKEALLQMLLNTQTRVDNWRSKIEGDDATWDPDLQDPIASKLSCVSAAIEDLIENELLDTFNKLYR